MYIDPQPSSQASKQTLLNGPLASPAASQKGRLHEGRPSREEVSNSPVELSGQRGESAILQLIQKAPNLSDSPLALVRNQPKNVQFNGSRRVLLTLVFTDIVASTETLERLGDRVWCALLLRHHSLVRERLKTFHGREIDAAGDGFFLVFDRPSGALRFAEEIRAAVKDLGIDLRIGIHTGECEVVRRRVEGLAVHTAARVANAAGAGEILVSSTLKDLVAGSEHRFSKKDLRVLKGLSEPQQLFALEV